MHHVSLGHRKYRCVCWCIGVCTVNKIACLNWILSSLYITDTLNHTGNKRTVSAKWFNSRIFNTRFKIASYRFTMEFGINYSFAPPVDTLPLTNCHWQTVVLWSFRLCWKMIDFNKTLTSQERFEAFQHSGLLTFLCTQTEEPLRRGTSQWISGIRRIPCTCDVVGPNLAPGLSHPPFFSVIVPTTALHIV